MSRTAGIASTAPAPTIPAATPRWSRPFANGPKVSSPARNMSTGMYAVAPSATISMKPAPEMMRLESTSTSRPGPTATAPASARREAGNGLVEAMAPVWAPMMTTR